MMKSLRISLIGWEEIRHLRLSCLLIKTNPEGIFTTIPHS